MASGICINCSFLKSATLEKCRRCGFQPITAMDFALSNKYSQHFYDQTNLGQIALGIREINARDAYPFGDNSFFKDAMIVGFLNTAINEPLFKYTFALRREARQGLLVDEVNVHTLGGGGYEYEVMKSREVPEAKRLPELGKHAFVLKGSNGQGFIVEDRRWFLIYDQHVMLERRHGDINIFVKCLDIFWSTAVEILAEHWDKMTVERAVDFAAMDGKFRNI